MTGLPGRILWFALLILAGWLLFSESGRQLLNQLAARWAGRMDSGGAV